MIFSVFLFNIIVCMCLVIYYTKNPDITEDLCKENRIYYYKILRYLLYVYIVLLFVIIALFTTVKDLNVSMYTNIFLIFLGIVTLLFVIFISMFIYPKKMQCLMTGLNNYLSLLPLIIIGIISLFLGYLGGILERCKISQI